MHNLKSIRENPDFFKKKLNDRNFKFNIKELLDIDKKNRETIQIKEKLEQEKIISKNRIKVNLKNQRKYLKN